MGEGRGLHWLAEGEKGIRSSSTRQREPRVQSAVLKRGSLPDAPGTANGRVQPNAVLWAQAIADVCSVDVWCRRLFMLWLVVGGTGAVRLGYCWARREG